MGRRAKLSKCPSGALGALPIDDDDDDVRVVSGVQAARAFIRSLDAKRERETLSAVSYRIHAHTHTDREKD